MYIQHKEEASIEQPQSCESHFEAVCKHDSTEVLEFGSSMLVICTLCDAAL